MTSSLCPLVLGSSSPRRRDYIAELGVPFVVVPPSIDESAQRGEVPENYVARIAREKLQAVRRDLDVQDFDFCGVVCADTIVALDDKILGKPTSRAHERQMVSQLCGRTHSVYSAYSLFGREADVVISRVVSTKVTVRAASPQEIEDYVSTGEGKDKAGAYAIQGKGAFLVERIEGSYTNVVGLPLCELVLDLKSLGLLERYP